MRTLLLILLLSALHLEGMAQRRRLLPASAVSAHFAGSTGLFTVGYHRGTQREKVLVGLQYGYTPARYGGPLHSLSAKVTYNPFRLLTGNKVYLEPLQLGFFLSQNFGENLHLKWPEDQYPKGYYWWNASLRTHFFAATSVSAWLPGVRPLDHLNFFFEANTNDLYLASYLQKNYTSMRFYDILFFGCGVKVFLRQKA